MKSKGIIKKLGMFILLIFVCLYCISKSGYIDNMKLSKTLKTEAEINKYEEMILKGEAIDIDDYYLTKEPDYENKFSNMGYKISTSIQTVGKKLIDILKKIFSFLFN